MPRTFGTFVMFALLVGAAIFTINLIPPLKRIVNP